MPCLFHTSNVIWGEVVGVRSMVNHLQMSGYFYEKERKVAAVKKGNELLLLMCQTGLHDSSMTAWCYRTRLPIIRARDRQDNEIQWKASCGWADEQSGNSYRDDREVQGQARLPHLQTHSLCQTTEESEAPRS